MYNTQEDGACDVPQSCALGTDLVDCRADGTTTDDDTDSPAKARARVFTFPDRAVLDAGNSRAITPATLMPSIQPVGTPITVVGHPSGLPRKYTGGAQVKWVALCANETVGWLVSSLTLLHL